MQSPGVAEDAEKNLPVPQTRFFAESQRLIENRHLPILCREYLPDTERTPRTPSTKYVDTDKRIMINGQIPGSNLVRPGKIISLAFLHETKACPSFSGYRDFCFYCRIAGLFPVL